MRKKDCRPKTPTPYPRAHRPGVLPGAARPSGLYRPPRAGRCAVAKRRASPGEMECQCEAVRPAGVSSQGRGEAGNAFFAFRQEPALRVGSCVCRHQHPGRRRGDQGDSDAYLQSSRMRRQGDPDAYLQSSRMRRQGDRANRVAFSAKASTGPGNRPRSRVPRPVTAMTLLSQASDRVSGSPARIYITTTTRK